MTERIDHILSCIKAHDPKNYKKAAVRFIDQQLLFYTQHPHLARVEIAYEAQNNASYPNFIDRIEDLTSLDADQLYVKFCEALSNFREEVINATT